MNFFITGILIFCIPNIIQAQQDSILIAKEISYTTDIGFNLRGGHRKGVAWLGQLNAILGVPLELPGKWGNGYFHVNFLVTHGSSLSSMAGDLQIASNIEAPTLATFFEIWYEHCIRNHQFKVGLIDVNAQFLYSDWALPLINSSFGIQPTLSVNIPLSIFPVSSPGMVWQYDITDWLNTKTGIFDGEPRIKSKYQILPDMKMSLREGLFMIQEFNIQIPHVSKPTSLKIGAWIHTGNFQYHEAGNYRKNFGLYTIIDKPMAKLGKGTLFVWGKAGVAPRTCNVIRYFNGGGLTYQNPFGSGVQDFISLAFASAFFCPEYNKVSLLKKHETVFELTIRKKWRFLTLQPDIQYILNPSGLKNLENPLCIILRVQVSL